MAQAVGDPDELERFAQSLHQFIDSLNNSVGDLNNAFASVGESWQDEKKAQFEEEYNAFVFQLKQFEPQAEEKILHLASLAARLRDYLQS